MPLLAQPTWQPAPARLALPDDELHVWRAALDLPASTIQRFQRLLSADEQARADRRRSPAGRRRFIAGRGMLRVLLGHYLGAPPERLHMCQNRWGRPELADQPAAGRLEFSVAHSRGLALYAFARGRAIGVDLEQIRAVAECERIARACLAGGERDALAALPRHQRSAALLAYWVCKEAYLKAIGVGLAQPLRQVAIGMRPDGALSLGAGQGWRLHLFSPGPGFVAALAAPEPAGPLRRWLAPIFFE